MVSRTDKFLQLAVEQDQDPTEHPCLQHLPGIFLRAMRGIAAHVDAFLGTWGSSGAERSSINDDNAKMQSGNAAEAPAAPISQTTPTPPSHRRLAKSFSVAPTSSLSSSSTNTSLKGNNALRLRF